jgi:hypothetical protein
MTIIQHAALGGSGGFHSDKRFRWAFLVTGLGVWLCAGGPATAQMIEQGRLSGRIVNFFADVEPGSTKGLLIGPEASKGRIIVTELCGTNVTFFLSAPSGAKTPIIASPSGSCRQFLPGLALAAGVSLVCQSSAAAPGHCEATGVSSRE